MQGERSPGAAHSELGTECSRLQGGLEASLAHAQGDHDQPFVMRRVCKRKSSRIVAFLFQGWVQEKKIGVLPGSKFVTRSICVKRERHRVPSNSFSMLQCHLIFSHESSSVAALQVLVIAILRIALA